ncbi:hypothetical protein [Micromonospora sp. CPCC 206061]|uniref:hypothetical protein n=1 Tax=Micromonospora sp. CPCC 206061 TaxID=3122410 RepID=UPI002FEF27FB
MFATPENGMNQPVHVRAARPGDGQAMFGLGMAQPGFEVSDGVRFYAREVLQEWIASPGRDILTRVPQFVGTRV